MRTFDEVWNDKMLTGIGNIDEHHRVLVRLLVDAYNAVELGTPPERVRPIVSELVSYTKYHFAAEERLMVEKKYPDLLEHRLAHRWFSGQVDGIFLKVSSRDPATSLELFKLLRDWLIDHILKLDKRMSYHVLRTA